MSNAKKSTKSKVAKKVNSNNGENKMKNQTKSEKYRSAEETIKRMELFNGSEEFKEPLTKKQFLEQWIGFNFKIQLKQVVEYFEITPDEVTHYDIIKYICYVIEEELWTNSHRPWDENAHDDEIKEGDLLTLDWY